MSAALDIIVTFLPKISPNFKNFHDAGKKLNLQAWRAFLIMHRVPMTFLTLRMVMGLCSRSCLDQISPIVLLYQQTLILCTMTWPFIMERYHH